MDPIGRLMGLRYKSHPWHGIDIGIDAPKIVTTFIEMVPSDTVKYEIDKVSGYLKIDRPQKYSNAVPALYGFIPQTLCGERIAEFAIEKTSNQKITGDNDPLDICILNEKEISHGDILVKARPIGGFRMIDKDQADDKIIAVMNNDAMYEGFNDLTEVPPRVIERLKHYFLTYKDIPGSPSNCEITHTYGKDEAYIVIERAMEDYKMKFENLDNILSSV